MPTQIDYSKRGIWENIFDPGAWQNLLGGVSSVVGDVADVWEQMEKIEGSQPLTPPPPMPPPYQPYQPEQNVKASAFILGGALLVVLLILWRK